MKKPLQVRREEEKEKRRKSILDAAEKVIARRGLDKAHFGEIAQKTRLSRSLIYVYFPTKEDLFLSVCERGLTQLQERFRAAASAHRMGLDQVIAIGRAYHRFSQEEPLYFEMLAEMQTRNDAASSPAREDGRGCLQLVAEALSQGLRDLSIRPGIGDPGATAVSIWAFTHGLIQISARKALMLEQDFGLNQERLIDHGFELLRGALAAA